MMGGAVYPGLCGSESRGHVEGMVTDLMSFILDGLIVTVPVSSLLDLL
jgi:hypothetical protein